MQLSSLRVLHLPKNRVNCLGLYSEACRPAFFLETCQRWIWVSVDSMMPRPASVGQNLTQAQAEYLSGKDAYAFLLRLAAGLESEILGETDIFGQLKEAWKHYCATHGNQILTQKLSPWIQRIFEDTKDMRTHYLQNLGGTSYGTLVRKLLKDHPSSQPEKPLFLVGAGQIAQAIYPFLPSIRASELWIWNRNPQRVEFLCQQTPPAFRSIRKLGPNEEASGWREASQIVICIPFQSQQDEQRVRWFLEGGTTGRSLIHLGGRRAHSGIWSSLPCYYGLDDLFQLEENLMSIRSVQLAKAVSACEHRAQLRALGHSLSIAHGWEDLACFA